MCHSPKTVIPLRNRRSLCHPQIWLSFKSPLHSKMDFFFCSLSLSSTLHDIWAEFDTSRLFPHSAADFENFSSLSHWMSLKTWIHKSALWTVSPVTPWGLRSAQQILVDMYVTMFFGLFCKNPAWLCMPSSHQVHSDFIPVQILNKEELCFWTNYLYRSSSFLTFERNA